MNSPLMIYISGTFSMGWLPPLLSRIIIMPQSDLQCWCCSRIPIAAYPRGLGYRKGPVGPSGSSHGVSTRSVALVRRFHATEEIVTRRTTKLIHEGRYAAEVS